MTERQEKILAAVIEQYAETPNPIGSVTLAKLFNVSPATIRSEMSKLEEMGYLTHPHTSAGRIPTDQGYRYYVNKISKQLAKGLPEKIDRGARAIKTRVKNAGEARQAIRLAAQSLAELTGNAGLATLDGTLYINGLANLFDQTSLAGVGSARDVASLIDNLEPWLKETEPNRPLNVYIGEENPIGKSSECTMVISKFRSPYSDKSYIGVIGPTRQDYRNVMRLVEYTGSTLEKILSKEDEQND